MDGPGDESGGTVWGQRAAHTSHLLRRSTPQPCDRHILALSMLQAGMIRGLQKTMLGVVIAASEKNEHSAGIHSHRRGGERHVPMGYFPMRHFEAMDILCIYHHDTHVDNDIHCLHQEVSRISTLLQRQGPTVSIEDDHNSQNQEPLGLGLWQCPIATRSAQAYGVVGYENEDRSDHHP